VLLLASRAITLSRAPIAVGGTYTRDNVRITHLYCNVDRDYRSVALRLAEPIVILSLRDDGHDRRDTAGRPRTPEARARIAARLADDQGGFRRSMPRCWCLARQD
jgi:hypothetical protein